MPRSSRELTQYHADPVIYELGPEFYDVVSPAEFPKAILRYRNLAAATEVGLSTLTDEEFRAHFAKFKPLPDNMSGPLALRYHGHQFRHYNPDLGDGRGFLFAQLRDDKDRLLDLGTKGSGQTPYSRQGDGRLTLLGGVREVLAAAYLDYLGVSTSRGFALFETGEALTRHDEPSPTRSAVLTRLQHSHIRFGTFQRAAFLNDRDALERLTDYCRRYYYPETLGTADFFRAVMTASADTVASWMATGFVHGVMNTDNMNITGESFDYGPYRFLPTMRAGYTAAYFDYESLYAFSRQPEIMAWNLARLAQSLSLITDDAPLISAMDDYADIYSKALTRHVFARLGIEPAGGAPDAEFVKQTYAWLEASQAPWPQFWHDWYGGIEAESFAMQSPARAFYKGDAFEQWHRELGKFKAAVKRDPSRPASPPTLLYEDIGALWQLIDEYDDWSAFNQKLAEFQKP